MHRLIRLYMIGLCLIVLNSKCFSQHYFGYYQNEKVYYEASPGKMLMFCNPAFDGNAKTIGLDSISKVPIEGFYIGYKNNMLGDSGINQFIQKANEKEDLIKYAGPLLMNENREEFGGMTDLVIVRLKSTTNTIQLRECLARFRAEVSERSEYDSLTYFILNKSAKLNALDLSNALYETGLFQFAEPDYLLIIKPAFSKAVKSSKGENNITLGCTSDPYFTQQWGFHNTGQNGGTVDADMDIPEAWGFTTGSNAIKIAILDDGVEYAHPDLSGMLAGIDFTTGQPGCAGQGFNGNPNLCSKPGDGHGTVMAGVIGGVGCNGAGVTGVAYTSKMISGRFSIGYNLHDQQQDVSRASWMATSIEWAKSNADIINMSNTATVSMNIIDQAINNAINLGRGGKGTIVLCAAGKQGFTYAEYPSSNPLTISVTASDRFDHKDFFSSSGTGVDIAAPGKEIWSTDLTGVKGYNENGEYMVADGTSQATAAVSGIAALMLSVNSNLTWKQLKMILEGTAEKVGGYVYSNNVAGQPNGSWSPDLGHGRVNAHRALVALTGTNILGPTTICSTGNFSLQVAPNVTRTWTSSNTSVLTINASSGAATRVGSSSGQVTISMTYSNGAASYVITKNVTVGSPSGSLAIVGVSPIGAVTANASILDGTAYKWYVNGALAKTGSVWNDSGIPGGACGQSHYLQVAVQNSCGTSALSPAIPGNYPGGSYYSYPCSLYKIFPNPAKDQITIEFDNTQSLDLLPEVIALYSDKSTLPVSNIVMKDIFDKKLYVNENGLVIDVAALPRGTYFLHFISKHNEEDHTEKIRVILD